MTTGSSSVPRLFPKKRIPEIVQDVLDACVRLPLPSKKEKRPEEFLSREVIRRLYQMPRYLIGPLEPHIESWLPDIESRADIRMSCGKGIFTYFLFEAKRLFVITPSGKKSSLVSEYIEKGMMRFVEERYAPGLQASAMLGYVCAATLDEARAAIRNAVSERSQKLCLAIPFQVSELCVSPKVDETVHRFGNRPFTLYHLFTSISL
jgi:hypothetical protein